MKIFIDVGGHFGQTLEAVIDPIYNFDIIYCFEPVKVCCEKISEIKDRRIILINAGLLDITTKHLINYPGSEAASIYSDHSAYESGLYTSNFEESEVCDFISAGDFFKEKITKSDHVVVKLNCEGSEGRIINSLIEMDQYEKIANILIDFDIDKIPSEASKKKSIIELINLQKKVHYFPEDVQYGAGSHFGGIKQWLNGTNERNTSIWSYLASLFWDLKNIIAKKHLGFYKFQLLKLSPVWIKNLYYKTLK